MNNDEQAIKQSLSQLSGPMVISRGGRNRGKKWEEGKNGGRERKREKERSEIIFFFLSSFLSFESKNYGCTRIVGRGERGSNV